MNQQDEHTLEELIDRSTVGNVLEAMARICDEKADHIATNYADKSLARDWHRIAGKLLALSGGIDL